MKKYKKTDDIEERENFENQVEDLIMKYIEKYPKYSKKYEEQKLNLDIANLKTLVMELIPPNSEKYSETEYPMFKYFLYTKYKDENDLLNKMNNKEHYPLTNLLLAGYPDVKKLKYLPAFNEFTNYMVNYYSFKISREEAKNRSLEKEDIIKERGFNTKYKNFIEAWEHIKSEAIKYQCRPEMEVKQGFSKKDKLINFLNDDGELYNGMYLASACQNFIEWQNIFLQNIVDANKNYGILHNYVNSILKKIPVQDAKPEQIVIIEEKFKKNGNHYIDFNDVIYSFSKRNIFDANGKIDYSNYNNFIYDYDKIEEELGKIILPGVCLFKGENELNFVIYSGEGFKGRNSNIFYKFYSKYPQIDLDSKEKKEVIDFVRNKNKEEKAGLKLYDFKNFYSSIQILLNYLAKQVVTKNNETIYNIIKSTKEVLKLTSDCINFFNNEGKNLTVNKIKSLFFYFEHLCFENLSKGLQPEYKAPIPKETKNKIIEKLLKEKNNNNIITVKDLGAATRRLISRYLVGENNIDIGKDRDLGFEISREELWEEKIGKLENLDELINGKVNEFKLTVGQAFEFYNLIGEDDRNIL